MDQAARPVAREGLITDHTANPELERWNNRFAAEEFVFGIRPNVFLAGQRERLRPGMRALCVADGEGRNSVWLAAQGLEVTAFDFSPVGLAKARKLADSAGVTVDYRLSDVNAWDWDAAQYDAVVGIFVQFASPPERQRMFEGVAAVAVWIPVRLVEGLSSMRSFAPFGFCH